MKGMIFDGESVRQILAGNKTQSRRIIKGASPDDDQPSLGHNPRYHEGETVYVKEAYRVFGGDSPVTRYKADGTSSSHWQTPLFMPESLSRIKLQIVRVGMERVQDISLANIQKEGIALPMHPLLRDAWRERWIEVNGRKSWDSNPWVWVYEFVRA